MNKVLLWLLLFLFFALIPSITYAATSCGSRATLSSTSIPSGQDIVVTLNNSQFTQGNYHLLYDVKCEFAWIDWCGSTQSKVFTITEDNWEATTTQTTASLTERDFIVEQTVGEKKVEVHLYYEGKYLCSVGSFTVVGEYENIEDMEASLDKSACILEAVSINEPGAEKCADPDSIIKITGTGIKNRNGNNFSGELTFNLVGYGEKARQKVHVTNGDFDTAITINLKEVGVRQDMALTGSVAKYSGQELYCQDTLFTKIEPRCLENTDNTPGDNEPEKPDNPRVIGPVCCDYSTGKELTRQECRVMENEKEQNPNYGIVTALGCVPTNITTLIGWIFKYAISIGGGIAFLLMVWGSFLLITSSGDPERLKQGQEILVSAGAGLLFIIFSTFLLRLIGVDILHIFF